jgi:large subunit ribosomal protein L30
MWRGKPAATRATAGETVKDKSQKTIHIKWIRSGIGFPRTQKRMVRSLGLGRLNQVVERPDTPQIRGLVEAMPHLVEIVTPAARPAWMDVPEYTILPPDPAEAPAPKRAKQRVEEPAKAEASAEESSAKAKPEKAEKHEEHAAKAKKPAKAAAKSKTDKAHKEQDAKKAKAAKSAKPAKKTKK